MDMYKFGIIAFFILIALIGIFTTKKVTNTADYYVSGRSASTLLIVGSLVASLFSAVLFTGEAGFAYDGYPIAMLLFATILCCGYILGAVFFGRYIRRGKVLTLPEFFGKRFNSRKVRIVAGITTVVAISAYLVSVTQASALLLSNVLEINYIPAMIIMWGVYTSFTFLSGAKGVLITDTIMFFFFFVATIIAVPIILFTAGGWPDAFINMSNLNPDVFSWHGTTGESAYMGLPYEVLLWIIFMGLSWGFVTAVSPWQTSRYLMAKNEHVVMRSGMLAPIPVVIIYLFILTTMGAFPLINDSISPSETVFIWAAINILPPIIGTIVLSGIMAAALSSCSTFLQLIGNSLAHDIMKIDKSNDKKSLLVARCSMLFAAIVILLLTISPPPSVMVIAYAAATMFAASWGPVAIASIFSKKVTKEGAFWSILVGLVVVLAGELLTLMDIISLPIYLEPVVIGSVLSTLTLIIVSKFTVVTEEEKNYRRMILTTPIETFNEKEMKITKRYPIIMIISGALITLVVFVYYYLPTQIL